MKICLIGDFSPGLDEGYKNVCHSLARSLADGYARIECANIKLIHTPGFWKTLTDSDTQIFHLISQPTNRSLLFGCLLRRVRPDAGIVLSALKPEGYFQHGNTTSLQKGLLRCARLDLMIVQSQSMLDLFAGNRQTAVCIPHGVDTDQFRPVNLETKDGLRSRYSIESGMPVVLHVGHLIPERNLRVFMGLPRGGFRVVIVGSTYLGIDHHLCERLRSAGVRLLIGYQPNIAELYHLADFYIFPVLPGNSLSMPLSVLEAMACNLTVITTRFPGLEAYFREQNGFFYLENADDLEAVITKVVTEGVDPRTREMVIDFSWQRVTKRLSTCYTDLLDKHV